MICWYYRWKISRSLDADDPSVLPRRHLERCPACREFHRLSLALAQTLREDALWLEHQPKAAPARRGRVILPRVIQAAAACLVLTALLIAFRPAGQPKKQVVHIQPARQAFPVQVSAVLNRAAQPLESLVDLAKQPILEEWNTTRREATAAGRALLTFLPLDLQPAPPAQTTKPAPSKG